MLHYHTCPICRIPEPCTNMDDVEFDELGLICAGCTDRLIDESVIMARLETLDAVIAEYQALEARYVTVINRSRCPF